MARRAQSGMTLVETLVALVILAGVVISAYAMIAQSTRFAATEQERLIASIVADNAAIEMMIRPAPPDRGEEEEEIEAAGRVWKTKRVIEEFSDGIVRITVSVSRTGDEQVLARIETLRATK